MINIRKRGNIQSESCGNQNSRAKRQANTGDCDRLCSGRLDWIQWHRRNSPF